MAEERPLTVAENMVASFQKGRPKVPITPDLHIEIGRPIVDKYGAVCCKVSVKVGGMEILPDNDYRFVNPPDHFVTPVGQVVRRPQDVFEHIVRQAVMQQLGMK